MSEPLGPALEPDYEGVIGETVSESTPWWRPANAHRSPNIVVVLLDDVGFAQLGCYGSGISTPTIDALAEGGVQYSNFHVAALCSPTRASLLTGRNHHSVGVGFLGAFDTGFPNYRAAISPSAATLPEMLKSEGYGSYAVGKWHLTPPTEMTPAGPFDQWPTQRGFDRYYGYLWGEDDQYTPELWYDQHHVDVPDDPDYHFSADIIDRAQEFLADHVTSRPDNPFFCYVAFGAGHAPHQAPREYLDRYRGQFDHGWDEERERILQRQIALGVVPADTALSERDPQVPAWADLTDDEKRLFSRMQEAFAGFLEHADEQLGRLIGFLRDRNLLDDTVVVVMTDNGASGEGTRNGTINEYRYFLGLDDAIEDAIEVIDDIGGPLTHNQYPAGWALVGNTPLKQYKKFTHGGGVRAPLVVHWPSGLDGRGVRDQFHHVADVVPTLLDIVGIEAPATYRGVEQLPVHGTSMRYSFEERQAPSARDRQYFETAGNRAIYSEGWKAVAAHESGTPFDDDAWELYDLANDFSETRNLAAEHPERLAELTALWWEEARRFGVLPLDDRMGARVKALNPTLDRLEYTMLPGTRLMNHLVGPSFSERGFTVSARIASSAAAEGVILAYGRRAFGFSFFVQDDHLVFDYNLAGNHTVLRSPLPETDAAMTAVALRISTDGQRHEAHLDIDGAVRATTELPGLIPGGIGTLSIQCGYNSPSAVSDHYAPPFTYSADLGPVQITLEPRRAAPSGAELYAELAFE